MIFLYVSMTSLFVDHIEYIESKEYYLEVYWPLYKILATLYLAFLPIFFVASYYKIKSLTYINKMRLKYICIGFTLFMIFSLLFLIIFPLFWKFYFIENIIFFITPFIGFTFYSTYTYRFSDVKVKIGSILVFLLSAFWAMVMVNLINYFYSNLWENYAALWGLNSSFWAAEVLLGILFYIPLNKYFSNIFLKNMKGDNFWKRLWRLKKSIPFITNLSDLNSYLWIKLLKYFRINNVEVKIFNKDEKKKSVIYKFFSENTLDDIFLNELVFIEENKHKFNYSLLKNEIDEGVFLVFPIYDNKKWLIWIFTLWKKPFGDLYSNNEINQLKELIVFLEGHLKYIKIYWKINDLTVNLDKKIDEKTMEYNNLINKQKEFISMISHEIKWPIASSIFQADCILDDVGSWDCSKEELTKELTILNEQLLKSWDLINKLFSVQYYDSNSFDLFKEEINLDYLFEWEIEVYKKLHPHIEFRLDIEEEVWFIRIDKVQFKQVIDNLLTNAVKFITHDKGKIHINLCMKNKELIVEIMDNGKGFKHIDISTIFDKYSTWKTSMIWLWMGLYLCKRIVELHGGEIKASTSKELWWAKFEIKIPV